MSQALISNRRLPRKIRFHVHEWDKVVALARASGLPPATFVRQVALAVEPPKWRDPNEEVVLALGRAATEVQRLMRSPITEASQLQLQSVLDAMLAAIDRLVQRPSKQRDAEARRDALDADPDTA